MAAMTRERPNRVRTLAAVLALALLAVACGSTVRSGGQSEGDLAGPAIGATPPVVAEDPVAAADAPGLQGPAAPATTGTGGQPAGGGTIVVAPPVAAATPPPSSAPTETGAGGPPPSIITGVTDTTVRVGATFTTNSGAANAALGVEGLDEGDSRAYYDAVIAEVNGRGGVAGRQLEPVYVQADSTSPDGAAVQQQADCEYWTRDVPVYAILDRGPNRIYQACSQDAGLLNISSGFSISTAATFREFPLYYEVTSVRLDRVATAVVPGLDSLGYFDGGAVVGVVTWDDPRYVDAVETDFRPALARAGQALQDVARITVTDSLDGVANTQAAVSAAVLRFRSQGIDHVMILDGAAGAASGTLLTLLFLQTAESQRYQPRYGFNTTNSQANETRYLFPAGQLAGSVGVTWDNSLAETDGPAGPNHQRERCQQVMRDAGVVVDGVNAQGFAFAACTNIWFLEAAVAAAASLEPTEVLNGINGLGETFLAPTSFGNRFAPDRHDGADLVRNFADDPSCSCYVYAGSPYRPS